MKEMNREMELNMNELEQVNGGIEFCIVKGFSIPDIFEDCIINGKNYSNPIQPVCEMGIAPEYLA